MTDTLFSVAGKRVLVTGGTSGLGRLITAGLAARGARVFTCSRKQAAVDDLVKELSQEAGLDVAGIAADLSQMEEVKRVAQAATAHFGGQMDVLINNAGATWGAELTHYPEAGWDKVFDLNVKAVFFMTQQCLPALHRTDPTTMPTSRVINIGSVSGIFHPLDGAWAYHPAKAAVHHMTKVMAKQLIKDGIAVNAIAPGFFPSKMTAYLMPNGDDSALAGATPLGRVGNAEDIVGTVVYLASQAGAFCVGTVLKIDGGVAL